MYVQNQAFPLYLFASLNADITCISNKCFKDSSLFYYLTGNGHINNFTKNIAKKVDFSGFKVIKL